MKTELAPDRGYIENTHPSVWGWRRKAVDKMARICAKLRMVNEVFHLAVHFLDRIIPRIDPRKVQLASDIGIVCVLVACKYEDRRMNMTVSKYYACLLFIGYQVDYDDLQAAEREVLRILKYDLGWPGPLSFLRRGTRADGSEVFARLVAKYILEIMTYEERFLVYKPSLQAAGALYIGRRMRTGLKDWPSVFVEESGYTHEDLRSVVSNIGEFLSDDLR
ncbi:MAG: cyclin-like protein, partial [Benniella sp.]